MAFNQIGEANVAAQEVTGFSGEDVPLEAPTNFTLNQIIDERSAILSWNPVNPDSVQGKDDDATTTGFMKRLDARSVSTLYRALQRLQDRNVDGKGRRTTSS